MNTFAGVFGMFEMEEAAEIIVAKQTGMLIDHGFLVPIYPILELTAKKLDSWN